MALTHEIRVLIADDHEIVIKGLSEHINAAPGMRVTGAAINGEDLLKRIEQHHHEVDIVLVDIGMEKMDGLMATSEIKEAHKQLKVIVITGLRGRNFAAEAIRSNADGFVSKSRSLKEIVDAIKRVYAGEMVMLPDPNDPAQPVETPKKLPELSPAELRILCMIKDGKVGHEIASIMKMGLPNVEKHRRNIAAKLDANNTASMVRIAMELGLCREKK